MEGFDVRIVLPNKLDLRNFRRGRLEVEDEESAAVDGLMFATTDHGDCFCFDLAARGSDYPVYHYQHELNCFEPYSKNFKEFVKRCSGE